MRLPSFSSVRRRQASLTALAFGLTLSLVALAGPTTLTVDPATVTAGPSPGTLNFNVTRSGDLSYDAIVDLSTADGTALAGSHYTATSGSLQFPAGTTTGVLSVPVAADTAADQTIDRTLQLIVDSAVGIGPVPTFAAASTFTTGDRPRSIAVADFNGDGRSDLATANFLAGSISVLLNNTAPGAGSTSFEPAVNVVIGGFQSAVAVGDFNGDGRIDLAAANSVSNAVSVLINNTVPGAAVASFMPAANFSAGSAPVSVAVGDVDGDGRADLAVAAGSGNVSVLLNSAAPGASFPSFASAATFGAVGDLVSISIGDLNGDGRLDLVTASNGGDVAVLLNNTAPGAAGPSFASATSVRLGASQRSSATIGDLNGDGRPDIAATNQTNNTVSVLINNTSAGASFASFEAAAFFGTAQSPFSVAIRDFDGDGRPELAVASLSASVSVLRNTTVPGARSARFASASIFDTAGQSQSVAIGDFNGDGKPDLATANSFNNRAAVLLNTTPRTLAPLTLDTATPVAVGTAPAAIARGDFNGDGRVDLAAANLGSNTTSILFNTTPSAALIPSFTPAGSLAVGSSPRAIVVADFNGDGLLDVATANRDDDTLSVLFNATAPGAASASFRAAANFTAPGSPTGIFAGDFNGDGRADLVTFGTGLIFFLFNTTTPGSANASFAQAGTLNLGNSGYATTGDFNGDGRLDLAYGDVTRIQILLNNTAPGAATASFAAGGMVGGSVGFASVTSGDLNGDGRTDLVIGFASLAAVQIALNNTAAGATTTTFGGSRVAAGGISNSVAVVDFDGDGRLDVLSADERGATASLAVNGIAPGATATTFTDFTPVATQTVGLSPFSVVIADFNNDGKPDFATANPDTNDVSIVLNTQLQASAAGSPATGTIQFLDGTPDAFSFFDVGNVPLGSLQTSNTITVGGFSGTVSVTVSGGFVGHNGGPCVLGSGLTVRAGDRLVACHTASNVPGGRVDTVVTLGASGVLVGVSDTFSSTAAARPTLTLSPTSLDFGDQFVLALGPIVIGADSPTRTVTLSNTSQATLNLGAITTVGDFVSSNTCGSAVAAGANCTIRVVFRPGGRGLRSGAINIVSDAASSPNSVQLRGTGVGLLNLLGLP